MLNRNNLNKDSFEKEKSGKDMQKQRKTHLEKYKAGKDNSEKGQIFLLWQSLERATR